MSIVASFRKEIEHFLIEVGTLLEQNPDPEDHQWRLDVETVIYNAVRAQGLLDRVPVGFPLVQQSAERMKSLSIVQNVPPDPEHWSGDPIPDGWTCMRELPILKSRLQEMVEHLVVSETEDRKEYRSIPAEVSRISRKRRSRRSRKVKTFLTRSERRAYTVAKIKKELDRLKRRMTGAESTYQALERSHPKFLTFKIVKENPQLFKRVLHLQEGGARLRLAQELTAKKYDRALSTVLKDWKVNKPPEYRRPKAKSESPH